VAWSPTSNSKITSYPTSPSVTRCSTLPNCGCRGPCPSKTRRNWSRMSSWSWV
jgi:hypothetical protein